MSGEALKTLQEFDVDQASVCLWTFKKTPKYPGYKAHWVGTTPELNSALTDVIKLNREQITEVIEYGILAQNNEASALTIPALETNAGIISDIAAEETLDRKVDKLKTLQNTAFYSIKLSLNDQIIHAIKKTENSWQTKRAGGVISVLYADEELELNDKPGFSISKFIDMFIVGDSVLIVNKGNFESVMNYKAAHIQNFNQLREEDTFSAIFTDLAPLVSYVGENKIQLRRISAIQQKGHYKNPQFMESLRAHCAEFKLNINFDKDGRIIPTEDNCRDIFQALLDHRLASHFREHLYDVQNTEAV